MSLDDSGAKESSIDGSANNEMAGRIARKDWSTTALGDRNNWSPNLKLIVGLMTASGFPKAVRWGPEFILIYNDGYRTILGDKHPWALGLPFRDVWPEVVSELIPLQEAILTGESPGVYSEDRPYTIQRHGTCWETAYFTVSYSPIPDPLSPTGIGGVLVTAVETTERLKIEKALEVKTAELTEANRLLREGQALYSSALAAGRLGTWETDLVAKTRLWTPEGMALFGIDLPGGRGHVGGSKDEYFSALHPDDRYLQKKFHELADNQDSFTSEYRVVWQDGTTIWLRGHGRVVARTPDGKAHRMVSIVADVTESKLAEQALRESEERLRMASESAHIGIWDYDLTTATLRWDERTRELFGLSSDAPVNYDVFLAGLHPDDRDATHSANQQALEPTGNGEYDIEYRTVGLDDGITRWIASKGKCHFENGQAVRFIGTALDIGRAKKSEELQHLLLREMDHRVKNLFAIVGGMTALSARSARTPQEMSQSLRGRLDALSRANDLVRMGVMGSEQLVGERTTMTALVGKVLLPYANDKGDCDRIIARGPDVPIGAKAVTSLALVLHESATNAAKYGALSESGGSIRVEWGTQCGELWLQWEETGGPAIDTAPQARGFGSILAERSIAGQLGGTISYDWRPVGVKLKITIPLERLGP
jgi:PAS domain S-box-containing protein